MIRVAGNQKQPAWVDEDDNKQTVDLAGSKRLKKLRHTEAETQVQGAEFAERLRKR